MLTLASDRWPGGRTRTTWRHPPDGLTRLGPRWRRAGELPPLCRTRVRQCQQCCRRNGPISVPLGTVVGTAALDGTAIARGAGTAFSGAVTGGHMGGERR